MEDNSNSTDTGTAMQAYTPVDDGWNSPIDDDGSRPSDPGYAAAL